MTVSENISLYNYPAANNPLDGEAATVDFGRDSLNDYPYPSFYLVYDDMLLALASSALF